MKYLFLFMLFVAPMASSEQWYEGAWKIDGAKFPGISAVGMEDISPYVGKVKTVSKASIPLRNSLCESPIFKERNITKEDFEFDYRATYEELGFKNGDVQVVSAICKNSLNFIFSHIIHNNGVTYGYWEGAFVALSKSKP